MRGNTIYGPYAVGTSAYSALSDWPGGGVVGIHGTDQPWLIPGRPSHGCIRMRNRDITFLVYRLPLGTPLAASARPAGIRSTRPRGRLDALHRHLDRVADPQRAARVPADQRRALLVQLVPVAQAPGRQEALEALVAEADERALRRSGPRSRPRSAGSSPGEACARAGTPGRCRRRSARSSSPRARGRCTRSRPRRARGRAGRTESSPRPLSSARCTTRSG